MHLDRPKLSMTRLGSLAIGLAVSYVLLVVGFISGAFVADIGQVPNKFCYTASGKPCTLV